MHIYIASRTVPHGTQPNNLIIHYGIYFSKWVREGLEKEIAVYLPFSPLSIYWNEKLLWARISKENDNFRTT